MDYFVFLTRVSTEKGEAFHIIAAGDFADIKDASTWATDHQTVLKNQMASLPFVIRDRNQVMVMNYEKADQPNAIAWATI